MYWDVFMSYDTDTELALASTIKDELWGKRKIKAFVAKRDIPDDTPDWDDVATAAIKNSRSVLVLYNKEAATSRIVKGEMLKANDFNRKVIIFKEENVERSELPIAFRTAQTNPFDINNPEDLTNRILEMRWQKNPNTIPEFHDYYDKAIRRGILNSSLKSDSFLNDIKQKLDYTFEYRLGVKLPDTMVYYKELKNLVNEMLEDGVINETDNYNVLKKEDNKKALDTLSVGIWKEGMHQGVL
jgi:hypothetical protein